MTENNAILYTHERTDYDPSEMQTRPRPILYTYNAFLVKCSTNERVGISAHVTRKKGENYITACPGSLKLKLIYFSPFLTPTTELHFEYNVNLRVWMGM